MIAIGILLLVAGSIFIFTSTMAYGDIGISMLYTGITAILAGIGFLVGSRRISRMKNSDKR